MSFHVSGTSLTLGLVRPAALVLRSQLSRTQMFEDEDTLINDWALTELRDFVQHTSWPLTQQHFDVIECQVKRSLGVWDNVSPCSGHWKETEVGSRVNQGKACQEVASLCWRALLGGGGEHRGGGGRGTYLIIWATWQTSPFSLIFHIYAAAVQLCYKESRETCHLFDLRRGVRICLSLV